MNATSPNTPARRPQPREAQKILGDFTGAAIEPLAARISATCNRVPVIDGHLIAISVELSSKPTADQIIAAMNAYEGEPQRRRLPSAPTRPVQYMAELDRPQPRRDAERDNGMTVFTGRLRECAVLDWKFMALVHNTIRGAAGAAVLNAELMQAEGMLG